MVIPEICVIWRIWPRNRRGKSLRNGAVGRDGKQLSARRNPAATPVRARSPVRPKVVAMALDPIATRASRRLSSRSLIVAMQQVRSPRKLGRRQAPTPSAPQLLSPQAKDHRSVVAGGGLFRMRGAKASEARIAADTSRRRGTRPGHRRRRRRPGVFTPETESGQRDRRLCTSRARSMAPATAPRRHYGEIEHGGNAPNLFGLTCGLSRRRAARRRQRLPWCFRSARPALRPCCPTSTSRLFVARGPGAASTSLSDSAVNFDGQSNSKYEEHTGHYGAIFYGSDDRSTLVAPAAAQNHCGIGNNVISGNIIPREPPFLELPLTNSSGSKAGSR